MFSQAPCESEIIVQGWNLIDEEIYVDFIVTKLSTHCQYCVAELIMNRKSIMLESKQKLVTQWCRDSVWFSQNNFYTLDIV